MEERALTDTADEFLGDLLRFKRYVFALDQLTQQHRPVFEAILRPDFPFASGEDLQSYFRDLQDHFSRLVDTISSSKDAVNGAFDIYVSHVSHRTNQVMKLLTLATVLLLPATIIIALFSTNIQGIPTYWPWSFLLMLCLVAAISGVTLLAFRRSGWL
jgi:magnesium transporter